MPRPVVLSILTFVLFLGSEHLAWAQGYWDIPVGLVPAGGSLTAPAYGGGWIAIGGEGRPHDSLRVYVSTDRGRRWIGRALASGAGGIFGGGAGVTEVAIDPAGTVWGLVVSYAEDYAPVHFSLYRSSDGSGTFSRVDVGQGQYGIFPARFAVSRTGDVYVLWMASWGSTGRLTLTRFAGGDKDRRTDLVLTADTSRVEYFDVTTDYAGLPVCLWSGGMQNGSSPWMYCLSSSDSAHLLDRRVLIDTASSPAAAVCDPQGRVYVLYSKKALSGYDSLFLVTGKLGEDHFGAPRALGFRWSSSTLEAPPFCLDSLGGVNFAAGNQLWRSLDGAETFSPLEGPPRGYIRGMAAGPRGELYATSSGVDSLSFCRRVPTGSYSGFYPLQSGNFWNYQVSENPQGPDSRLYRERTTVVGDTLMPNGLIYWELSLRDPFGGKFVRVDSGYVRYYEPQRGVDMRMFNLQAQGSTVDSISWGMGLMSITAGGLDTVEILGKRTTRRDYHADGLTVFNLTLADSFGIVHAEDLADGAWPYDRMWTLLGGSVGGKTFGVLDHVREPGSVPGSFRLEQNYPNPFNPATTIRFILPGRSLVSLTVFNTLGQKVAELVNGQEEAGEHQVQFTARGLASGVYFYRLMAGGRSLIRSMIVVK